MCESNFTPFFKIDSVICETHTGKIREHNEDFMGQYLPESDSQLPIKGMLVVSDGMGGHAAGEVASQLIVEVWTDFIKALNQKSVHAEKLLPMLKAGIFRLQQTVLDYANQHEKFGMGATFVSAVLIEDQLHIFNIGDSPAFLFREGKINPLFTSDNHIEQLYYAGILSREEVEASTERNRLHQAIGYDGEIEIHHHQEKIIQGDRLLLCSDGLSDYLFPEDLEKVLNSFKSNAQSSEYFIQQANMLGGKDNITVALATIAGEPLAQDEIVSEPEEQNPPNTIMRIGLFILGLLIVMGLMVGLAKLLN